MEARDLWLFRIPGLHWGDPNDLGTNVRFLLAASTWVLLIATAGIVWAWAFGFLELVGRSADALWALAALTVAMTLEVVWASLVLPQELGAAAPAFHRPDEAIKAGRDAVRDLVRHWWSIFALFAAFVGVAVAKSMLGIGGPPLLLGGAGDEWVSEPVAAKLVLVAIWALPPVAVAATGTYGLLVVQRLVGRLTTAEVLDAPMFVLPRVRRIVLFTQITALGWSIDLFLFLLATSGRAGFLSYAFILLAASVIPLVFLYPHLSFHMVLRRMQERVSADTLREADHAMRARISSTDRFRILTQLAVDPSTTWAYDVKVMASFTLSPLISAALSLLVAALRSR